MLTIQQVAKRTEVAAATLRTWERRYGVPSPERTPGGYRLYSAGDLAAIGYMKALLASGLHPHEAAVIVAGGGRLATVAPGEYLDELSQSWSIAGLDDELSIGMTAAGLEDFADRWLMPMLQIMGERWCAEGLSIGVEHEVTAAILRRLSVLWHELAPGTRRPTIIVGLPGEARHEIGAFVFAVLLRREGFDVRYLGADLPADGWTEAIRGTRPCLVVTAVHRSEELAAADELIRAVRGAGAGAVALGGKYQDRVTEAAIRLGHGFTEALQRMLMLTA